MALAQERTVKGKVTSAEDGSGLPGVNVVVKGTTNGTVTDAEGNYKINVPSDGGSLVFSFIGLATSEVAIGDRSTIDVSLASDVQQLSEVVVTAAGIEREKKALGYSVASVSGASMQQRSEPDPLRALQGKMPGVNISGAGGAPGQSTRINIRGFSSLTGNTQPLFVVDGIPFDNGVNAYQGANSGSQSNNAAQGTQYSNRAFDLDPNNIEAITVLKGAAAAALYGSRATNGVVVVTTKAGKKNSKKGLEIAYNGSVNFEEISGIPDFQNKYMQGSNQNYNGGFIGNWGAPFPQYVDQINQTYFGGLPRYSRVYATGYPEGTIPNQLTGVGFGIGQGYGALFPQYIADVDYNGNGILDDAVAEPARPYDIIGGFFQRGSLVENGITINSGGEKHSINAGFSRMSNVGITPNQETGRTSINFGGSGTLDNGLFISGSVNYVNTTQQTPQVGPSIFTDYSGGAEGSIFSRIFYLPRNFDLNGLPFENPVNGNNVFYRALDNPRWIAKYNLYNSNVHRVFGNMTFQYDIKDWLQVTFKGGMNTYSEARRSVTRKGGVALPAGQIFLNDLVNTEQDYNLIFTATKDIAPKLSFRGIFGGNANQRDFTDAATGGADFIVPDLYTLRNTSSQINFYDNRRQRRLFGVYTDLQFTYNKFLNVNLVARNDWASTLPVENRSFFYPGASVSFVLTDATDVLNNVLSFAKIRAAYTNVGREADPYLTNTVYQVSTPFTGAAGTVYRRASLGNQVGNLTLVNEKTREVEFGAEFTHKSGRVSLDITYFKRNSIDQIIPVRTSSSSGFSEAIVNAGEIENRGWEIGLDVTPLKMSNGFTWNMYGAFTRLRTEVINAGPQGQILLGGVGGGSSGVLGNIHKKGSPFGQIYGTRNARDEEGNLLINGSTGLPYPDNVATIIGNPIPDFTLGLTNTFSWKGITLTALLDWKQGGQFYSVTAASLFLRGQLQIQEDREGNRVVPGVYGDPTKQVATALLDDNGNKIRNTTGVNAFDYHFTNGFGAYGADETNVYDGTVIRLREISLGYSIPKNLLSKTPFGSARISISGRNLWWKAPNVLQGLNLDPEVLATTADTNIQGFEAGATPTTRRYGVNISLTF
jgi:TonB-linked SusC/RagA family outer membrane protein